MLQLINPCEKQKENYPINKESHKIAKQLDLTLKEMHIKDHSTEAAKTIKKEAKTKQNKKSNKKKHRNKIPKMDGFHKVEIPI